MRELSVAEQRYQAGVVLLTKERSPAARSKSDQHSASSSERRSPVAISRV
jgi:hypothetical protein